MLRLAEDQEVGDGKGEGGIYVAVNEFTLTKSLKRETLQQYRPRFDIPCSESALQ